MIDWPAVFWGALQVGALALLLASASFANWRAHADGARWHQVMARPRYTLAALLALGLFSAAQIAAQDGWLLRSLWGALTLAFGWESIRAWKRSHKHVV